MNINLNCQIPYSWVIYKINLDAALNHVHGLKLRITSLNDGFQSEIPQTMFVAASIHSLNYGIQFEMPQQLGPCSWFELRVSTASCVYNC
jgi:hypothetical protein